MSEEEQKRQVKQTNQTEDNDERLDLILLVNAKKMGFSLEELNEIPFLDYLEMSDIYTGNYTNQGTPKQNYAKQATQSDIDTLLS